MDGGRDTLIYKKKCVSGLRPICQLFGIFLVFHVNFSLVCFTVSLCRFFFVFFFLVDDLAITIYKLRFPQST